MKKFAMVYWVAKDIKKYLRPYWSMKRCREFLRDNERLSEDLMASRGWNVIIDCLPTEGSFVDVHEVEPEVVVKSKLRNPWVQEGEVDPDAT